MICLTPGWLNFNDFFAFYKSVFTTINSFSISFPLSPSSLSLSPVATDPTIVSLAQVSATTVRVEWSQPSGGASVTGYNIHYSDGSTDRSMSAAASSTSADITGLTNSGTYSISVEATSENLFLCRAKY